MSADFSAGSAAYTFLPVSQGPPVAVHFPLPGAGAAAHSHVFHGAAYAGLFVALKMGEGNDNIRIHHRPANFGSLHIFAALHWHVHLVRTFQAYGTNPF